MINIFDRMVNYFFLLCVLLIFTMSILIKYIIKILLLLVVYSRVIMMYEVLI